MHTLLLRLQAAKHARRSPSPALLAISSGEAMLVDMATQAPPPTPPGALGMGTAGAHTGHPHTPPGPAAAAAQGAGPVTAATDGPGGLPVIEGELLGLAMFTCRSNSEAQLQVVSQQLARSLHIRPMHTHSAIGAEL